LHPVGMQDDGFTHFSTERCIPTECGQEDVTEIEYRPTKCKKGYRLVILRKTMTVKKGQA